MVLILDAILLDSKSTNPHFLLSSIIVSENYVMSSQVNSPLRYRSGFCEEHLLYLAEGFSQRAFAFLLIPTLDTRIASMWTRYRVFTALDDRRNRSKERESTKVWFKQGSRQPATAARASMQGICACLSNQNAAVGPRQRLVGHSSEYTFKLCSHMSPVKSTPFTLFCYLIYPRRTMITYCNMTAAFGIPSATKECN